MRSPLIAAQLAALAAATCRYAAPDLHFREAPWGELARLVPLRSTAPPSTASLPPREGAALWLTDRAGPTFHTGTMGSPRVPGWATSNATPAEVATLRSAADASEALRFAARHRVRISVRSTGHDWFGRSAGQGTLLLWTHKMAGTAWHDDFTPAGCAASVGGAASLAAGVQFWQYYAEAMQRKRMVVGGTCPTVGHVGFSMGGGYGDYSRMYGSGATNLVEAEVVLADGSVVTASNCNDHADLFRALRGGGGAFGLITKATYRTYPYPEGRIGSALGTLTGLHSGIKQFMAWYGGIVRRGLGQHIGGQVMVGGWAGDNVGLQLQYVGITAAECSALFSKLGVVCRDGGQVWPPRGAKVNPAGVRGWQSQWEDRAVLSYHRHTLQRYVLPEQLEDPALASAVADAAKGGSIWLALNYALGHSSAAAMAFANETTVHPQVYKAVVVVKWEVLDHGTAPSSETPVQLASWSRFEAARARLDAVLPGAGSYYNEGDYTDEAWQERYWGANYPELLRTKAKYDPGNAFSCHQCVGSEAPASCGRRLARGPQGPADEPAPGPFLL